MLTKAEAFPLAHSSPSGRGLIAPLLTDGCHTQAGGTKEPKGRRGEGEDIDSQ